MQGAINAQECKGPFFSFVPFSLKRLQVFFKLSKIVYLVYP